MKSIFLFLAIPLCFGVKVRNDFNSRLLDTQWDWSSGANFSYGNSLVNSRQDEENDDGNDDDKNVVDITESSNSTMEDDGDSETRTEELEIPKIDFYSSLPNAMGFTGLGLLWIREFSATLGTPIVIYVLTIPMLLWGLLLVFYPDLGPLNLPLFYPGGGPYDPLAKPDLNELIDFHLIKELTESLTTNGMFSGLGSKFGVK